MPERKTSRPLLLFYILLGYVLLQFAWWSYMLFDLNQEIIELKKAWVVIGAEGTDQKIAMENELTALLKKRWSMILGEGSVFLTLLLIGGWRIQKAFKEERSLNERQKNFMLSITHELKSPIASAQLQLETLQKRNLEKDKQQLIISNALEDTERLNNLVENILLATRIENNALTTNPEKVNLSKLTSDITKKYKSILCHISPEINTIIDIESYTSILKNLIENAFKYSTNNHSVTVTLAQEGNNIKLSVMDQGIGIPDNEKENIFKKFYRIGSEETRKTKGTGLGLFIVKNLVNDMHAQIFVKNNQPNGVIFEVVFNLK